MLVEKTSLKTKDLRKKVLKILHQKKAQKKVVKKQLLKSQQKHQKLKKHQLQLLV